jgi:hypothetical protein
MSPLQELKRALVCILLELARVYRLDLNLNWDADAKDPHLIRTGVISMSLIFVLQFLEMGGDVSTQNSHRRDESSLEI